MTASLTAITTAGEAGLTELTFHRTIDRALVHRASVAEVFITDLRATNENWRFLAAAQLPLVHGFYSDHTQRPAMVDPLLVLEAGRQAGIAGAHLVGIPADVVMLVGRFTLQLTAPHQLRIGRRPLELRFDNTIEPLKLRLGRVRRGVVKQDLYAGGVHVGTHVMECQLVTYREHEALRGAMRGTPAPSTKDFTGLPDGTPVPPAAVGRTNPRNVVLRDLVHDGGLVTATVSPRLDNWSLFDHDYDHLPAMTLTEAARQLALAKTAHGTREAATDVRVAAVTGSFHRFAELDSTVTGVASHLSGDGAAEVVRVEFRQEQTVIAEATVTLARGGIA